MIITYYGTSCFKVQSGDYVIAFDPPSKESGIKAPRFQADMVLLSHNHAAHNGADTMAGKGAGTTPFVVAGAGEYEVRAIQIIGIPTYHDDSEGKKHGTNTTYMLNIEDIRICHLGDFGESALRPETKEQIGAVDILFLPIGGETVMDTEQAVRTMNDLEPRITIPMHYDQTAAGRSMLKAFLKESGEKGENGPVEKLTIKKKDMITHVIGVVVLQPQLGT
ncbi:MAG: MBL fold metallo-hydrolase [Parcubacteria group bacterium]|nr:MBL fold metallo-hydrolase [Parcubacteria group bacterium]